jgi:HEAT repeat protein
MRKRWYIFTGGAVLVLVGIVYFDPTRVLIGLLRGEGFYRGRPVSYWAKTLEDDNPSVQEKTFQALVQGKKTAVPVLVALLQNHQNANWRDVQVRWKAATILGRIGPDAEPGVESLIVALTDPDAHVRRVAVASLGAIAPAPQRADAVEALVPLLKTGDRVAAVEALARFGPRASPAVPALIQVLGDADEDARWNAADALGQIGPEARAAVPRLIAVLKDESAEVREHSAESLGQIGAEPESVIPALVMTLKDENPKVRRDAARSLGQFGPKATTAVLALQALSKDTSDSVREAVAKSLLQIDPSRRK